MRLKSLVLSKICLDLVFVTTELAGSSTRRADLSSVTLLPTVKFRWSILGVK